MKKLTVAFFVIVLCGMILLLVSCKQDLPDKIKAVAPHESLNAVLWMQKAAEYKALCQQTYNMAQSSLEQALANKNWCADLVQQKKGGYQKFEPAVILDADETILDNSVYQARLVHDNIAYSSRSWNDWCKAKHAQSIPGALKFCQHAAQLGVTVFYVTNRKNRVRKATRQNLQALGFPLKKNENTVLTRGKDRSKDGRRSLVAAKYRIILLFGDNCCDFSGQFDRKLAGIRDQIAKKYADYWGNKWFMLPNPSYGDWEGAILNYNYRQSQAKKWQMKRNSLQLK